MLGKKKVWAFLLLSVAAFCFLGASAVGEMSANRKIPTETETAAKSGACNLLFLGRDDAAGLCDVLMLVSFDMDAGHLHIVQIPRDTYFAYTADRYKKINAAPRVLGGADRLAEKLSDALGVPIDGYVEFDLDFVASAVDAVGGLELNVPCDMDYEDPEQDLSIHLKKGVQTLTGKEAVGFIRFRSGYVRADLGRMDAQKLFLAAFAKSFSERVSASELPRMLLLAMRNLKSNVRLDTMLSLAGGMRKIPSENIVVLTLPGEEVQSQYSGAWYYILSREGCEETVLAYLADSDRAYAGFDPKGLFTDAKRSEFHAIYEKKIVATPYTFEGLMSEGVEIQ